jgi:hypothetical protein
MEIKTFQSRFMVLEHFIYKQSTLIRNHFITEKHFMKNFYQAFKKILLLAVFIVSASTAFSQLKIGTNPTVINKSSILELESDRQGFLLPRLTDTVAINALTPPDGMLIYLNTAIGANRGLYIRKAGIWQRFVTDSVALDKWSKSGDVLLGTEKFGSTNAQTIRMITNNVERFLIDGTSGNVSVKNSLTVDSTTTTKGLVVADSVNFNGLNVDSTLLEVLVIAADGSVRRRSIKPDAFKTWVVGAFDNTATANGLSRKVGATTDTLVLHAANATNAGGVSIGTQDFGGKKTFVDSLTAAKTLNVGAVGTANSTLQVQGSVSLSIKTVSAAYTLADTDYTVLVNAASAAVTLTLPTPAASINGRTYIIKKIAGGLTNDVVVNGAIEDGTSVSLYNDWTVLKVQTDGSKWYVVK